MTRLTLLAVAATLSAAAPALASAHAAPPPVPLPVHVNATLLERTWALLAASDPRVVPARDAALASARAQLAAGPWSVTAKAMHAPSGDVHDYASIGVYWWPCTQSGAVCNATAPGCDAETGMPWVSCDGHFDTKAVASGDQPSIAALGAAAGALSSGFYWSRDEAFAERLVADVEAWFLDPATRMNPNLDFGQRFPGDPGYTNGSFSGIIEVDSAFSAILDALALVSLPAPCQGPPPAPPCPPSAAWTPALQAQLVSWLGAWSQWMEGPFGTQACSFFNNHQTWCRSQWTHVSLWLGDFDRAVALLNGAKEGPTAPIGSQIWRNGELHNEEQRVNSIGYVGMDMAGLLNLGQSARNAALIAARGAGAVGDLFEYVSKNESSIRGAVDYMLPFVTGAKPWPFPTETQSYVAFAPLLRQAAYAYGDAALYAVADAIANASAADASRLFWPPMAPAAPAAPAAAAAASAAPPALFDLLSSAPFLHAGTVASSDAFGLFGHSCSYLEPENVTVAPASGIGWTEGGSCPLLFVCPNASSCAGPCAPQPPHAGFDRAGGDYRAFNLPATPEGAACAAQCCAEAACVAWVYAPAAPPGQEPSCAQGEPCCYLKAQVPPETPGAGLFNGLVDRAQSPGRVPPPIGIRSSAPLGGLGAGALELRGDGTIHEVTIVNQSPAGAAKFGVLADMMLGARVGGVARALRTAPPPYAAGAGASALTYSALYPLARLAVAAGDFGPDASVAAFAYSTLVPGDPAASAAPAVVFTLAVQNSGATPLDASFFLSLPLGAVNDCARRSSSPPLANFSGLAGPAECLAACAANANCSSWTFAGGAASVCRLARDVPLSVHEAGSFCGLRGAWGADGTALTLAMPCTAQAPSPACGDATLRPVLAGGAAAGSLGAAADPALLWRSFAATGAFADGGGVRAGSFEGVAVGHGAAAVSLSVAPFANATLSIVFAWYFAHRDHDVEDIGQFYSTVFEDSADVARTLAAPGALEGVAADLAAHHAVFAGAGSSLPDWLADFILNSMSHFRGMIWSRDGRMREFEAFDCMDLDSIHNDYQRHLPYLWLMPQFEAQKLRKWASGQDASGFIQEFLGPFGVGPFDVPGGRIMGDTTTLWVVELLELWRGTGDDALLDDLYPTAARALAWLMANAAPLGLPERLYSTYDILWMDRYNTTSYNSFLYMAALRAGGVLAARVGDADTAAAVAAALARAQAATQALLWNASGGFFRAYSYNGDNAVMADALYGQVIAHGLGLGFLVDPTQLASHLRAELLHNYDDHGFVAITNRATPPPDGNKPDDDTLWQQAGPDWSAMALMLGPAQSPTGSNVSAALDPARRQLDNWRSRLRQLWNLAGITTPTNAADENESAQPFCTSHYGFALTAHWLLPALSGQQTDLSAGALSFAPALPCPMRLPALSAGLEGVISCDAAGAFTLSLAFGSLELPAGGLSANGRACAAPVSLGPGDSVSW